MLTLFVGTHLAYMGHFGYFWHFGPHPGAFSPLLLFFGMLFLFAILGRRGRRWNRPPGGWGGYRQGGGPQAQRPYTRDQGAGTGERQYNTPQANPYYSPQDDPYAGYGDYGSYGNEPSTGGQGTPTVRVDPVVSYDAGAQTIRMESPAPGASSAPGGQPTLPLGEAPVLPEQGPVMGRVPQEDEE